MDWHYIDLDMTYGIRHVTFSLYHFSLWKGRFYSLAYHESLNGDLFRIFFLFEVAMFYLDKNRVFEGSLVRISRTCFEMMYGRKTVRCSGQYLRSFKVVVEVTWSSLVWLKETLCRFCKFDMIPRFIFFVKITWDTLMK